jgi:1,2-diacylglycerol 3-alpha-glucosyltransferase
MRIGIFTNNYLPNPYGVTSSIESFRRQFEQMGPVSNASRSDAGRHEVFIFAPYWKGYLDNDQHACPPENFSNKNFGRIFRYPSIDINFKFRFPLPIPYSRKIDKIIADLDLDVIHSQHPNLLGAVARRWAKKKNIPLVFTWHTLYDQYAHFATIIPKRVAAWWMIKDAKKYANGADYVVAPTPSVIEIIKKWGVTNPKIKAIASGVEEELFANADADMIKNKFGIKNDELILVLNCRLTSEKNTEFLFRSVIPVLKENKKVKLLSVGGGYLLEPLRKMAEEAGVGEQVIFVGQVKKEEVKDYFAAGDIFVYASKSETQGMIITEAMYMGLPVVAVNATGICDLVEDKITGFLVPEKEGEFFEAVSGLINNESLRKKMGENGARIAREKYTDKICAQKLLEIYREAIESKIALNKPK